VSARIGHRHCRFSCDARSGPAAAVSRSAQPADVLQHLLQAHAIDALHRVVENAVLLAVVEDRHDVGMVQPRGRAGLGLEPPQIGRIGAKPRVHDLERHPILERLVLGLVDDSHAPSAQLMLNAIATQPLEPNGFCGRLAAAIASMARIAPLLPRRFPIAELGQQLQRVLAGVAIFHVHFQLFARGVCQAFGQQELELLALRACHHSLPSKGSRRSRSSSVLLV
jgi:hypothetical protein